MRREERSSVRLRMAVVITSCFALLLPTGPVAAQGGQFKLAGLSGGQLTNADLAQGTTIAVVWASWSPRCRDIVERVNALQRKWGSRGRVIAIDFQEDKTAVQGFLTDKRLSVPVYLDSEGTFSKQFQVTTLPSLLVFEDGRNSYRGRLPADPDNLISEVLQ